MSQDYPEIHGQRVRAAEHAPRGPFRVLQHRHSLAEIIEWGAGVEVERPCDRVRLRAGRAQRRPSQAVEEVVRKGRLPGHLQGLHELFRPLWGRRNGSQVLPQFLLHQVRHRRDVPRLLDAAAAPAGTRAQARAGLRPRSTAERRSAVRSAIPNPASPALHTQEFVFIISICGAGRQL